MRLGYVASSLGRGGAELQVLRLASGLVKRGHQVHVLAYGGPSVLDAEFRAAGVDLLVGQAGNQLAKVADVRSWMRRTDFDVVHGVMKRASSLSLLARLPGRWPALVATDMSTATYGARKPAFLASLAAFGWMNRVVTQTELNRINLERLAPWLRGKTVVIRNGVDTERFSPNGAGPGTHDGVFKFCVVGTLSTVKNPLRVVDAAAELVRRGHQNFRVDWYGRDGMRSGGNFGVATRSYAAQRDVRDHIVFHGETADIERAYERADGLLHASIQEGFPNVVVEGMACGLPIVVSRVSDLPQVVAEARNGFVFDETDPSAMADAMERLMQLTADERAAMGARSREVAVRWFGGERFLDEFETLYRALSAGRG